MKMTPRAREQALENAYEKIKGMLIAEVKSEISTIQRMEASLARRARIDPLYLNWFLVNGKNWPSMPPKVNRALRAIQSIYLWYGAVPNDWSAMDTLDRDGGRSRDKALVDLGRWFLNNTVSKLERKYVREIYKTSQELVKQFRGNQAPRDPKAAIMLMRDFERRLVADRFQLKPAIQEIVDLFS